MTDINPTIPTPNPVRTYQPSVSNSMKWWLALFLGLLAFLIFLGGTYNLTNNIWIHLGLPSFMNAPGCPKAWGVLIHAIIFALIVRLILW
jgi:hypothetical protein